MVGKVQTNGGKWYFSPSLKRTKPWRCFVSGGEKNGAFKVRPFFKARLPSNNQQPHKYSYSENQLTRKASNFFASKITPGVALIVCY